VVPTGATAPVAPGGATRNSGHTSTSRHVVGAGAGTPASSVDSSTVAVGIVELPGVVAGTLAGATPTGSGDGSATSSTASGNDSGSALGCDAPPAPIGPPGATGSPGASGFVEPSGSMAPSGSVDSPDCS